MGSEMCIRDRYLESISEADAKVMIQTIETFYQVMCERRENFEK